MNEDIACLNPLMMLLCKAFDCTIIMSEKPKIGEDGVLSRGLVFVRSDEAFPGEVSTIGPTNDETEYIGLIIPVSIIEGL